MESNQIICWRNYSFGYNDFFLIVVENFRNVNVITKCKDQRFFAIYNWQLAVQFGQSVNSLESYD